MRMAAVLVLLAAGCGGPPSLVGALPARPADSVRDEALAAAFADAEAAVRGAPDDADRWARLAMVHDANGFPAQAAEAYEMALGLRPDEPKWNYHLAWVLEREDHFILARVVASKAARLAPDYPPLPRTVALWYLARGQLDEAETHARRAVELSNASGPALVVLGRVLLEQDRAAEAADTFERAVDSWGPAFGDVAYPRFLLARAAHAAGRSQEAPPVTSMVEPPILPDPWRAEVAALRAGRVANRRK